LHWGSINNVGFNTTIAPPLQVLKHFKFKLFFNVEPNLSIESMTPVGSSSYQRASSSTFENIKVKTKACLHSNTNLEQIISSEMEPLDSFKPLAKKKPMRFYEKTHVF
jgi:hypothetical protein